MVAEDGAHGLPEWRRSLELFKQSSCILMETAPVVPFFLPTVLGASLFISLHDGSVQQRVFVKITMMVSGRPESNDRSSQEASDSRKPMFLLLCAYFVRASSSPVSQLAAEGDLRNLIRLLRTSSIF